MQPDLSQLLGLGQVQQEVQKRYSDALAEKRRLIEQQGQYQTIAQQAGERFKGALSSDNPVILNPQDVFGAYQTFNAAIKPGLEAAGKYTTDQDLLSQIASIAQQREKQDSGATIEDLVKQRQTLADAGFDTTTIDLELGKRGFKKKEGDTNIDKDLAKLGLDELAKQKDTLDKLGIDSSKISKELERRGYGKGVGDVKSQETKQEIISTVQDMLGDSSLFGGTKSISGGFQGLSKRPGTKASDMAVKFDRLKSLLTVENLDLMKGVLSDSDIKMLKSASSELDRRQSESEFRKSLEKIATKLGGTVSQTPAKSNAPLGVQVLTKFLGNKDAQAGATGLDTMDEELINKYKGK